MLTVIAALDNNGAIGKGGAMPWYAPADLKLFQRETSGAAVIMGRNTWQSLPVKPLPRRLNCIVSQKEGFAQLVFSSFASALAHSHSLGYSRVYAIGGTRTYEEGLKHADRLIITRVDTEVPDPDTWFPDFDESDWRLVRSFRLIGDGASCRTYEYFRHCCRTGLREEIA